MVGRSGARSLAGQAAVPVLVLLVAAQALALATHVWSSAGQHQWLFLLLGTVAYPVGVTHGVGVWFSLWR